MSRRQVLSILEPSLERAGLMRAFREMNRRQLRYHAPPAVRRTRPAEGLHHSNNPAKKSKESHIPQRHGSTPLHTPGASGAEATAVQVNPLPPNTHTLTHTSAETRQ